MTTAPSTALAVGNALPEWSIDVTTRLVVTTAIATRDFQNVHRCGLLAAESRAGQRKYYDIELAVAHLHGMLEALLRSAATHPQ